MELPGDYQKYSAGDLVFGVFFLDETKTGEAEVEIKINKTMDPEGPPVARLFLHSFGESSYKELKGFRGFEFNIAREFLEQTIFVIEGHHFQAFAVHCHTNSKG